MRNSAISQQSCHCQYLAVPRQTTRLNSSATTHPIGASRHGNPQQPLSLATASPGRWQWSSSGPPPGGDLGVPAVVLRGGSGRGSRRRWRRRGASRAGCHWWTRSAASSPPSLPAPAQCTCSVSRQPCKMSNDRSWTPLLSWKDFHSCRPCRDSVLQKQTSVPKPCGTGGPAGAVLYVVNRILDQGGSRHMGQWAMPGQCTVVLNLNPAENNCKSRKKGQKCDPNSSKTKPL